ncbi:arginine--tRNA ligase [Egicoccus halophilus]|uniref:Arginine--tRNA ligase n=1 Tax=Egicoccus halophilus TaxID=1670830 RepID=A0A8J3A5U7_9ACTN|nr:arginine--tRNA ligase [Egicoccus halophilus]GGI03966.1 arginine--tRNA ligase [Egicoccus halophilus]
MARPELLDPVLADLAGRIRSALGAAGLPEADPDLERPRQAEHGDWATTVPLRLAKPAKRPPREIAQAIVDHLELPDAVEAVEIAGPGFVNFRLAHRYHQDLVRHVIAQGEAFGRRHRDARERETINLEFVSANPTGPLHVGAGRWAAVGDAIAALLEADGHEVTREYYVNDAGEQIRRFGESVVLTARGLPLGEGHYRGSYLPELVEQVRAEHGEDVFEHVPDADIELGGGVEHDGAGEDGLVEDAATGADPRIDPRIGARVGVLAVEAMRQRIAGQMHQLGVDFDVWFSERTLHDTGSIDAAIAQLTDDGRTYESEGATFLRTSEFGDDKDRVIVRSDGRPTYFAADCAYLRDKWARVTGGDAGGGGRLYYLLGADHHGYVGRLLAAAECLGIPRERVEIRIGQLVNLLRGGEPVRMSKRTGEMIALDEVVDEVGADVTRYHFLRQGLDTMVDFDLEVVAQQSMENPVYYVQYAHARINSLVRTADERGFEAGAPEDAELSRLTHPAEVELLSAMAQLPIVVDDAAELRATQRLARYAEDLAATFHRFYTECRVLVEGDEALSRARYWLAVAARQVLANALGLLRVTAPERM